MTTEDIWCRMQRRVPPVVSEYFRGGADAEITLHANVRAFQQSFVNAEGATRFEAVDTSTTVLDHRIQLPWYITPVGSLRTLYPKAEAVAAKVAGQFGTVMGLSTLSGTPMEEVAQASSNSCWFQLYLCGGRETALRGIAPAAARSGRRRRGRSQGRAHPPAARCRARWPRTACRRRRSSGRAACAA